MPNLVPHLGKELSFNFPGITGTFFKLRIEAFKRYSLVERVPEYYSVHFIKRPAYSYFICWQHLEIKETRNYSKSFNDQVGDRVITYWIYKDIGLGRINSNFKLHA